MKRLFLSIFGLFFCSCLMAQKDLETKTYWLAPESELNIAGSTNVNSFVCRFNTELISGHKSIKYTENDNFIEFSDLKLRLKTNGFDCGNRRMNEDFRDLLRADTYPEIIISVKEVELISPEYIKAYISVELAGKKKQYDLPVQASGDRLKGKFRMNIRDFGLEPPKKALGLIEVDEMIEVQFNLVLNY